MNKLLVLVVDDNLVSRLLPCFILRPFGALVQVLECDSGMDAIRLMKTHHVTHILLDISMPNMDGIKVAEEIRLQSKNSTLQLIAYTADAQVVSAQRLKSMGFNDVLLKPINSADLLKVLGIQDV